METLDTCKNHTHNTKLSTAWWLGDNIFAQINILQSYGSSLQTNNSGNKTE
jgi:hypothetical protein